ncbi:MAG: hypothetical protein LBR41_03575 [Rickettsiales bacterium]|jgi:hypothetical protein|nr:hypothetical protein [Rickettsiales bacterium]
MKNFIKNSLPYIITIALWRLEFPIFNPGGILALVPIFYYSFIRHKKWFPLFAAAMCFLIDKNIGTVAWFGGVYLAAYAFWGLQNFISLRDNENLSIAGFLAIGVFPLAIWTACNTGAFLYVFYGIWLFAWLYAAYYITKRCDNAGQ